MRKTALLAVAGLLGALSALAVPADPRPRTLAQPAGDSITVQLLGDEYYHYYVTLDGYTLLRDEQGRFTYATRRDGRLVTTGVTAHDASHRSAAEQSLLSTTPRHLTDRALTATGKQQRARRDERNHRAPQIDYDAFRGLVVLINYKDVKFTMDDVNRFYDRMCNEDDYSGFSYGSGWSSRFYSCTGSMRDYYRDNSMGRFVPSFDVVGPVTVDLAATEVHSTENAYKVFIAALDQIDGSVDLSRYDFNGDGYVDMVYFIVAGFSANYGGNNDDYLWPHQSYLYDYDRGDFPSYDGVYMWRYACSTEMYGWEGYHRQPLGIATMTHEFSHVLGLPDLYDTDYADGGGQSHHPGEWDVMSGGDYNEGRTPVGYTIWERYALGFASPTIITTPGDYVLNPVATSNEGYILPTPVEREYFILDNRQRIKWDAELPGTGMLIARVDSTDAGVWYRNEVNCNPAHNYYELLRAGGSTQGAMSSDPFPGTGNVTRVTNFTTPALTTWNGSFNDMEITNIKQNAQGVVTFTVSYPDDVASTVEDFETMPVTTAAKSNDQPGRWAKWSFINCNVMAPEEGNCDDLQAVGMYSPSQLTMTTDVEGDIFRVSAHVYNLLSSVEAKFKLYCSLDEGATWNEVGNGTVSVPGGEEQTIKWTVSVGEPVRFRLNMTSGTKNKNARAFIDSFTLNHIGALRDWYEPEVEPLVGDVNGDGVVNANDVAIVVNIIAGLETDADYMSRADVSNDGMVNATDIAAIVNIIAGLAVEQ